VSTRDDLLVWIDLEMTGLEPESCAIVEMAMILTDRELEEVAPPFEVVIWQPEPLLETMSPFVRKMHETSGLIAKIRASSTSIADAEKQALEIVSRHATFGTARLCGNSVWQDRRFLNRHMPSLERYLHYRQIDVTSVKELGEWWYREVYAKPSDKEHTALFDIQQSIAELRHLRSTIMK
jgi:oligoribonuclease